MASESHHIHILAEYQYIADAYAQVGQIARHAGLSDDAIHHCQLAVDEICTNIIEHGYRSMYGEQFIEIECQRLDDQFVMTIKDNAPFFDPMQRPSPNPNMSLEERKGGGWGVFFVRKIMDEVIYRRVGQQNHLILIKRLY
jgi:serine/threonine-protein kinase RsbW